MDLKFIKDLQEIANDITYNNGGSVNFITEKDIQSFFETFAGSKKLAFSYGVSYLKSRMTNDYEILKKLVELRQKDIQEKQLQNEGILKITNALNDVGNMLDQTSVNLFPLSDYRQSLDSLIEELEEEYCIAIDEEDYTEKFNQAGKEMLLFFENLESDIKNEPEEALMPPKEEIAELVKKIFLDYDLATFLIFETRKFERNRG